jgi:penicillin-binding protein 1A
MGLLAAGLLCLLMVVGVAMVMAYPNLPDISDLANYKPKLPLRVFTADGQLMGEFGEERRNLTPIQDIPKIMKDAVLSIEDNRFYDHGGVDYLGILRAGIANIGRLKSQGASTITMQVARNVYLSSEKTYTRKIYEILLTYKLEHLLTKDQILEIYMNQIFLGNRAYGFASAAETYFGKPLKDITIAEAAMLAGLPKAPSAFNPIANPKRARGRKRLHYRPTSLASQSRAFGFKVIGQQKNPARRICRRNRPANGVRSIWPRHLYPWVERLHHHSVTGPNGGLPGVAPGSDGF